MTSPPPGPHAGTSRAFREALDQFQQKVVIPSAKKDQFIFRHSNMNDAIEEIRIAERKSAKDSRTRRWLTRIHPFLSLLDRYSVVVDTCVQYNPSPSALIWGGLKLIIKVAGNYSLYFDGLMEMVETISISFPRLEDYEKIFYEQRLKDIILKAYVCVIKFLTMASRTFSTFGLKVLMKVLWKPLHKEVEAARGELKTIVELADIEFHVISATRAESERKAQAEERQLAAVERASQTMERERQEAARVQAQKDLERQVREREVLLRERDEQRRFDVMTWLTRSDTDVAYTNAISKHTGNPNSCKWVYETHEYQQWAKDSAFTNSLWVHSGPGTGKSVLTSHIIRTLKDEYECMNPSQSQAALGFFFCNGTSAKDDLLAAVRTILCQFLDYLPTLPREVELEFQESRNRGMAHATSLQLAQLQYLLLACLKCFKKTCIIIDGLDECEERHDILEFLSWIYQERVPNLRILAASRPEPDIAAALQEFQPLKIRPSDTKSDLLSYIATGVRSIPDIDEHRANATIKVLSKKASGMFIWVRLVIELLKDAATPAEFEEILATIPRGLHQIYCLVIERLHKRLSQAPPSRRNMARNIFCWLAVAPKAISIEEMREALAFAALDIPLLRRHRTKSKPNGVPDALDLLRPSAKSILSICATLVDHDEVQGTLRLLHHTAKEFLTEMHDNWERSATVREYTAPLATGHAFLAKECLKMILAIPNSGVLVRYIGRDVWLARRGKIDRETIEAKQAEEALMLRDVQLEIGKAYRTYEYACRQLHFHLSRYSLEHGEQVLELFRELRWNEPMMVWFLGWVIFHPQHRLPSPRHFRRLKRNGDIAETWLGWIDFLCQGLPPKTQLRTPREIVSFWEKWRISPPPPLATQRAGCVVPKVSQLLHDLALLRDAENQRDKGRYDAAELDGFRYRLLRQAVREESWEIASVVQAELDIIRSVFTADRDNDELLLSFLIPKIGLRENDSEMFIRAAMRNDEVHLIWTFFHHESIKLQTGYYKEKGYWDYILMETSRSARGDEVRVLMEIYCQVIVERTSNLWYSGTRRTSAYDWQK